ncbi:polyprenyl synthetase family protein [Rhizobium sp. L1K21]|uniref:polyprenyl synthetase family protein n=1 Tax=Rhizobium sp. L1K21 TaxID=2954933 RepID=UPI00209247E8|nr:farnesyl diphosphate synthase [Rhizobium sp. L1K21]MCO6188123.1 polyprenyl synthetase family protein [Rhizobium sp. L1K21]
MNLLSQTFADRLAARASAVEAMLNAILTETPLEGETARPAHLLSAMRHGVLNGGKRFRPFLVLESAALFGFDGNAAMRVAAALECLHCYSLVHDDLPAMDDDDLRRGRPTVHVAYDDATAILAGDALLTLAFDLIADPQTDLPADRRADLVLLLARAAGIGGMVGGQVLDIAAETKTPDEAGIITLQAMKTGALLRFACEAGAVIAGAGTDDRTRLRQYGEKIGLAFQLADDLLDLTADTATLGKAAGKDAGRGKGTLPALHGEAWTRKRLGELVSEAESLLEPFGERAAILKEAARFVANRDK